MSKKIYLDAPNLGELEKKYLCQIIDRGFISSFGPEVSVFEEKIAKYLEVKKAVSVQSGTAALHIALCELGIGDGDEVIVPNLTFVATANSVMHVRATPVFVDVDQRTWNINPDEIEKNITKRTKVIIPVHFHGNPCDMEAILDIAAKYDLKVIEDAAESLGAKYKGKYTGSFADYGCFSFNGNKIITTGGGGMVVGNDQKGVEHIRFLVNQAKSSKNGQYHTEVGFNYRMTNIEAALGLTQMQRLEEFLTKKRAFNAIYKEELKDVGFLKFQEVGENTISSFWFTSLLIEKDINITRLQSSLRAKGIPTRRIFMPLTEFPPYKKYKKGEYRNSYHIYEKGLCLPSSTLNSKDNIFYICNVLKELME